MAQALSRRERKKLETRQALLESALALFREKGFEGTTVEEITDRADVAKGTFFNYFLSKHDLLSELAAWRFAQLHEVLDVSRGAPSSPVARIELLMRLLYEQMVDDWRLFRRAFASGLGKPHQRADKHKLSALVSDLVCEAQTYGEIRDDVEADLVSDLLFVAYIRRLAVFIHKEGTPPPANDFERVMDLLMTGLAGPNWGET